MNANQKQQARTFLKMKLCRYCHATEDLTIDHKIPIIQGGTHEVSNLQCLCRNCNTLKGGMSHRQVLTLFRWLRSIDQSRLAKGKKLYYQG